MASAPRWKRSQSKSKKFRSSRRGCCNYYSNLEVLILETPLRFKLKSSMVGLVIGRSGSTIKEIQNSTNTKIQIIKGDPEAEVKIFGKKEMKLKAKAAIENIVQNYEERKCLENTKGKGKFPDKAAKGPAP